MCTTHRALVFTRGSRLISISLLLLLSCFTLCPKKHPIVQPLERSGLGLSHKSANLIHTLWIMDQSTFGDLCKKNLWPDKKISRWNCPLYPSAWWCGSVPWPGHRVYWRQKCAAIQNLQLHSVCLYHRWLYQQSCGKCCDRNGLPYRHCQYIPAACTSAGCTNSHLLSVVTEMASHTDTISTFWLSAPPLFVPTFF